MKSLLPLLQLSILCIVLTACGGGTSGTDGGGTVVRGRLISSDGTALSGYTIIISETSDSALSKIDGTFEIALSETPSEISFTIITPRTVGDDIPTTTPIQTPPPEEGLPEYIVTIGRDGTVVVGIK
jgi:hypothetical protein